MQEHPKERWNAWGEITVSWGTVTLLVWHKDFSTGKGTNSFFLSTYNAYADCRIVWDFVLVRSLLLERLLQELRKRTWLTMAICPTQEFHSATPGVEKNPTGPGQMLQTLWRTACDAIQAQLWKFYKLLISCGYKLEMNGRHLGLILYSLLMIFRHKRTVFSCM